MGFTWHNTSDIQDNSRESVAMRRVFGKHYYVRIKQMYLQDEEVVSRYGAMTTMNPDWDYELANSLSNAQMNISDMAEFFSEGITINFDSVADVKQIYGYIRDYVEIAAECLNENGVTETQARHSERLIRFFKDIQKFEDLANALYPMFMRFEPKKVNHARGFQGSVLRLNKQRDRKSTHLTEEQRRIQLDYRIDIRKWLSPQAEKSLSIWSRRGER